ncbi:DUF2461 domain-containing protein [Yoonia sp. SS1-5]|uniref:DUF2461 domain-containing protein n=1 Tax=Yoonia rhodophyticola TaxID=3137370 RepID=A0AAN0M5Q5_9RHOB
MTQQVAFTDTTFQLLEGLRDNNNKEWYAENKAAFKAACLDPFALLLDQITNRVAGEPLPLEGSEQTMFRMHRDVRFSKDKSPYKPSVSGMMTRSGTKAEMNGMAFIQMDPTGGFVAGGFYRLPTPKLNAIRQRIIDQADEFSTILDTLKSQGHQLSEMQRLTRMPKGFTQYDDHIHAEHVKLKGFIVRRAFDRDVWVSGEIAALGAVVVSQVAPLLQFGMDALQDA